MRGTTRTLAACAVLALVACAKEPPAATGPSAAGDGESAVVADAAVAAEPAVAVDDAVVAGTDAATPPENMAPEGFDITTLPLSTQALGDFPFFSIPEGYAASPTSTHQREFTGAAFWNGHDLSHVEGRLYATGIRLDRAMRGKKEFSDLEVVRNLQQVVTAAGGVEIATGETPREVRGSLREAMRQYGGESNCHPHSPRQVFVLRRDDGNVWVSTCRGGTHAGLVVLQEQPLQVTSTLLPASELEQALADDGRVALQVHFATDRAQILPDSQPQIAEVVALLQRDSGLKLSIQGHTDNTGDAAHNRELSQARAASVVSALTQAGIAADRLDASGHGDSQPVADNATAEGRAANRRVELVRRT